MNVILNIMRVIPRRYKLCHPEMKGKTSQVDPVAGENEEDPQSKPEEE